MFKLRSHQQDALNALQNETKGRVVIPTGGGKTAVEAFALRDIINSSEETKIHVVLAPRIALVNQLIKEYRSFIGQNYLAVAFHSGRNEPDFEKVRWSETATTKHETVVAEFERAKRMNKDLVIFSTYASCHKLARFNLETLIADESQYCISEGFFETVRDITSNRKYFFTATERHTATEKGRGLNNTEVFGEVLYQVAPRTLIDAGYIVAPRLHVMSAETKSDTYTVIDEVIQLAAKQIELSSKMPVRKVLFAMKGTDDVKTIIENVAKIKSEFPTYKIFTIVSNSKFGSMVDGEKLPRGNFMKELRECDNALIFHYDILSEGMDIDGITGVALLRNMKKAKMLQTIGRAVRIYKSNPSLKTQAWISAVAVNNNEESASNIGTIVRTIRDGGFDCNIEDVDITDADGFGIGVDDELEDVVELDAKAKAMSVLENVFHDIEQDAYFSVQKGSTTSQLVEDF